MRTVLRCLACGWKAPAPSTEEERRRLLDEHRVEHQRRVRRVVRRKMAHHKRRRPKHQRSGCLMCKPHKDERVKRTKDAQRASVRRKLQTDE